MKNILQAILISVVGFQCCAFQAPAGTEISQPSSGGSTDLSAYNGPGAFTTLSASGALIGASTLNIGASGDPTVYGATSGLVIAKGSKLVFKLGTYSSSEDGVLVNPVANTLAMRNGAAAQRFETYDSYTDYLNYSRLAMYSDHNYAFFTTEKAGTGAALTTVLGSRGTAGIYFQPALGLNAWQMTSAGHWVTPTDNTYDIGASGAKPRDLNAARYITSDLDLVSGRQVRWTVGSKMSAPSDGVIKLLNGAETNTGTIITRLPTSSAGLDSGTLWNNAGTPAIAP